MKTYLLLALLSLPGGETDSLVLDHGLSQTDCQAALEIGIKFPQPPIRSLQHAALACEIQESEVK